MTNSSPITPDAIPNSWVDRMPDAVQPYLRLMRADRPIGTWLLLIPCWWGVALAAIEIGFAWQQIWFATLFAVGAFAMRGAGCVYNDIVDQDIDAKVERTAARPLPSGRVSTSAAWGLLALLCLIGLAVLVQFNRPAIITGISALALVAAYPFMKRITWWPQAWLGLTFNWGALVGFNAVTGAFRAEVFALYAAGIFWTLGYDTIYAHQDKDDDALIGVKSSALRLGDNTKPWLAGFYSATIGLFALAGYFVDAGPIYYFALLPAAAHFAWQVHTLEINQSHNCLRRFKSNRNAGLLLALAPISQIVIGLI